MKLSLALLTLAAGLFASTAVLAQAPSAAPTGSTGLCKDGSYTSNATKKGACAGHKGVKDWYGSAASATTAKKTAAPAASPMATGATATGKIATPAPIAAPAKAMTTTTAAPAKSAPAAGGGTGQVWVNSSSKVYHCPGTKYYGKTKQGQYMTEAAAKAAGNHAAHGKSCTAQ
ncbi:MAG: DUF3761 domain-containing protein [Thiobacillaceae bacterium]